MERLIHHKNSEAGSHSATNTVTEWLNQGFDHYKTSTALHFKEESLSYDELNHQSDRIANYLAQQGIEKGDRVGICLERSTEMIASILGILKSGAAYVPLDPGYPVDRLEIMREDARLSLLLAHEKYADRFETNTGQVVFWEEIEKELSRFSASPPAIDIDGEDIAYVIFTSGSTGRPKGIAMPHRALANLIEWQLEQGYFKREARVIQYSSISFDVSFQEIATTLASGGTLFLIEDEKRRDPRTLLKALNYFEIERLFIPFVALRSLVEAAIYTDRLPGSLTEVITAGEQLRVDDDLRKFFSNLPESVLENQYGPSETHVISAYLLNEDPSTWSDLPPIGTAIKNNSIYILNEHMEIVEEGETGELYLAGENLAHGYLGREELTKKSFVRSPSNIRDHEILYKTGDLGKYNKEGEIEFLGRADHQIKIRGYRVEPGEINTVGATHPGIAHCITHSVNHGNNTQLVTYYVCKRDGEVSEGEFKAYLSEALPGYMVPAFVLELDAIPYTPSGKVNFKALPRPASQTAGSGSEEKGESDYRTETEARLAEIWSKLLGFENISRTANFFDLGGDSLNAFTLFIKIEEQFDMYLPLSVLTQAPTIAELSRIIDGDNKDSAINRFRSLQLIQRGTLEKPPLFMVHGGAGNVIMFKDLAKGLPPDQPVYAFQWSGWDGYKGEEDIVEMAKFYKKELREAWPQGPYRLGGHCIGGIIAIEIANLLKAEGAEVLDPILVSDAPNLYSDYYHTREPEASEGDREVFQRVCDSLNAKILESERASQEEHKPQKKSGQQENYSVRRYPILAKYLPFYHKIGGLWLRAEDKMQRWRIAILKRLSIKIPLKDRHRYSTASQLVAIKKHEKTVYEGDILYLKSEVMHGRKMGLRGWWNDIFFGFRELCTGRFDGYVIGGAHNDVLEKNRSHQIIREKMFAEDE
ncbi:amino acid adenylation domain-containing protein [Fodinibius sp.]|uniref:amino acid adenylation domain-containing protein n=1 Tax=Fodinibius sp. TaxID=1872440 RepID=UPI003564CDBF